jgi:hypothetical protein
MPSFPILQPQQGQAAVMDICCNRVPLIRARSAVHAALRRASASFHTARTHPNNRAKDPRWDASGYSR